ncbi:putative Type II secretion system core protein G [Gammaproteobacteria bacterium]
MPARLIFILAVILSIGAIAKMAVQLFGFFENNAEILNASTEVNEIVRVIYIDYVISGRGLNSLPKDLFSDYLRKRIKIDDSMRDPAKDPWLMSYRITVRPGDRYEIRSAGPDLEFNTNDDIIATGG